MTMILEGAALVLLVSIVLLVSEVLRARRAKSAAVHARQAAQAQRDDDADLTRMRLSPAHAAGLPVLRSDDQDDEGHTESKAITIFEKDAEDGIDEPTGSRELILLQGAATTDVGRKRKRNEDHYLVLPDHGVYVVADGMGGYAGGDIASKLAVDKLAEAFAKGRFSSEASPTQPRRANELVSAINEANHAIFEEARANSNFSGMGTTLLAARFSTR